MTQVDGLAVGLYADGSTTPPPTPDLSPWVSHVIETLRPESDPGVVTVVPRPGGSELLYLVGLGADPDPAKLRRAATALGRSAKGTVLTTLDLVDIHGAGQMVLESFGLGSYRFDRYKTASAAVPATLLVSEPSRVDLPTAEVRNAAAGWMTDLILAPPADKYPGRVAELVAGLDGSLDLTLWQGSELLDGGFGGILAVGQGSPQPPLMIDLRHRPADPTARVTLVGKGVVFDSGGLSIKSAQAMADMKTDIAGAACVIAVAWAAAKLSLPVEIRALAPIVENAVDGNSLHPGDVVRVRDGTTIEVVDTDAEGRLILADALALAAEDDPDLIIDVASLTLGVEQGLGPNYAALFTNDDAVADSLLTASKSWDALWRLPFDRRFEADFRSPIADIRNISGRDIGGAVAAAVFLERFTQGKPWAHIDLGDVATTVSPSFYLLEGSLGLIQGTACR